MKKKNAKMSNRSKDAMDKKNWLDDMVIPPRDTPAADCRVVRNSSNVIVRLDQDLSGKTWAICTDTGIKVLFDNYDAATKAVESWRDALNLLNHVSPPDLEF